MPVTVHSTFRIRTFERGFSFFCVGTEMHYAIIGQVNQHLENELQLLKKLALADVFKELGFDGKKCVVADFMSCLKYLREEATCTFERNEKDVCHINSCASHLISRRSENHVLINQHPELTLNATGVPIPTVIIQTAELPVLGDIGVADLADALLNASGLNLLDMSQLTPREALCRFRFDDYGVGSHNSFKTMMTRALANRTNIRNWYSRYISKLRPEEDNMRNSFPDTREFYQRLEDEGANLMEHQQYEQYIVPGEDNEGDYIRHGWYGV